MSANLSLVRRELGAVQTEASSGVVAGSAARSRSQAVNGLALPDIERIDRPDGAFVLRSRQPLQEPVRCIGEWLDAWALKTPDAIFLAERGADDAWVRLSYGEARRRVGRIAQALIDMALPAGKPLVVLSDNSIDHALLLLAGLHVGRPVSTVSSAYSRLTQDYTKLKRMLELLDPALVYADDAAVYGKAVSAAGVAAVSVFSRRADQVPGALSFNDLLASQEGPAVAAAFARIRPDDHAKYLLTSGSTGTPKVVINTHRMLCANQQAIAQVWTFLNDEPPVMLDWLPWSHTFGANHNFNMALMHGGSIYIDEGRPMPGLIDKTVRNLREVRPTLYFNVPRGFDALAPLLENDREFAKDFFGRLRGIFYAAAALSQSTWSRIEAAAIAAVGHKVWFTSAWGSTETSPLVTSVHFELDCAGCIGLPVPGLEIKFVPVSGKLEMWVRGPSIFPGYLNAPEATAAAFDAEGFYGMGDAGLLVDADRPEAGILFNGRITEDFKLSSGTWVSVGPLRIRAVSALAPHVQDAVVTGHDREDLGLMVFLTPQGKALPEDELTIALRAGLKRLRAEGGGSSQTPVRLLVLHEPPSAEHNEITDKGYLNQRALLARRAADVQRLHAGACTGEIICITSTEGTA